MAAPIVVAAKSAGQKLARAAARRVGRNTANTVVRRGTGGRAGLPPNRRRTTYVVLGMAVAFIPVLLIGMAGSMTLALFAPLGSEESTTGEPCGPTGLTQSVRAAADTSQLDSEQQENAAAIIEAGRAAKVPEYGWVVGLATALQESTLRNIPYGDRDSVGLFQQRAAWGSFEDRMDPRTSATMFYTGGQQGQPGLLDITGWESMTVTDAAQAVQRSAYPNAYADDEPLARAIVAEYTGGSTDPRDCGFPPGMQCPPTPWPQVEQGLTPDAIVVLRCTYQKFPQFEQFYGVGQRPTGGDGDHANGRAVDAMLPFDDYKTQAAKAYGWTVANWLVNNRSMLGVKYIIFDKKIWSVARQNEGWRDYDHYSGCTSDTCLHYDHVHVSVYGDAARLPDTGDWVLPVPPGSYNLTARFGDCGRRWEDCHTGLDFAASEGTPVRAAAAGTVVFAGRAGPYGNLVKIDHGSGVVTSYAHLRAFAPGVEGATVIAGQMIGEVGTTGNSTGPHLHFEVRVAGRLQDPELWLSGHGVPP
ncbi:M23 family metallopeptidase [Actinopolymorpha alba]|uniref:M23 family metallopeptidase n=1 Tax=Actinopolymorpha alba TaxID=533267 RepID=UPI000360F497|nr:M23 family metallopeptidase [Actinopolymorpha alba]